MVDYLSIFTEWAKGDSCRAKSPKQFRFFQWKLGEAMKQHPKSRIGENISIWGESGNKVGATFFLDDTPQQTSTNYVAVELDTLHQTINVIVGEMVA